MKIEIKEPNGPYKCTIDTDCSMVTLKEAFVGVRFETAYGEKLAVSMRDSGFEIHYWGDFADGKGFDTNWISLNNGVIKGLKESND